MRERHSMGGVRKQRGRWIGLWYENGIKKSRVVGLVRDMTKGEAREAVGKIVAALRATQESASVLRFGGFVENVYFPFYTGSGSIRQRQRALTASAFIWWISSRSAISHLSKGMSCSTFWIARPRQVPFLSSTICGGT